MGSAGAATRAGATLQKPAARTKISSVQETSTAERNGQFDWNAFRPRAYRAHNYRTLRDDDRQILCLTRDYFAANRPAPGSRGLDVGPGANLYPALAMLPFCAGVDLVEFSESNVRWLRAQQHRWRRFDRSWDPFWRLYGEDPVYRSYVAGRHPLVELRRKGRVSQGSIFDLPAGRWDVGTMFFVACSLSADRGEFEAAVRRFVGALKPDAPFAAAFMTGSNGYEVKGVRFPAVRVDAGIVEQTLQPLAVDTKIVPIHTDSPLRHDTGMVLALGRSRGPADERAG